MKKLFTLAAAAFIAASVNAQSEQVIISADESYSANQEIATANCKVIFGDDSFTAKAGTLAEGQPFEAYVSGANNPKDSDGAAYTPEKANRPVTGSYFTLVPTVNGKLEVGAVVNASKPFFVIDENSSSLSDYTLTTKAGDMVTVDDAYKLAEKFYGTINIDVTAGKAYTVFCTGSKLGFYGYIFTPAGGTAISTVKANSTEAPMFNLAGQKVDKSYKGMIIQGGIKFMNK